MQVAAGGIVTGNVCVPVCIVVVDVDPAGRPNPSAMMGWVADQVTFRISAGVQLVPLTATGSGKVVSVWPELGPSASETRNHPGCAIVTVIETVTVPPCSTVTVLVGVPAGSPSAGSAIAAQGPFF